MSPYGREHGEKAMTEQGTTRTVPEYTDYSLGFPITISNAPQRFLFGKWVLDIERNEYQRRVLSSLARRGSKLTDDEVRFVCKYFIASGLSERIQQGKRGNNDINAKIPHG